MTSRVPTAESESFMNADQMQSIALVAQALVRRQGGAAIIPVSELMETAGLQAHWDRVGDNIVIKVDEHASSDRNPRALR